MADQDMWVFAYGSLMWKPGFDVAERMRGRISGYARSFCMWSIHHRGTEADPGLVLALDPSADGHCDGVALRVSADRAGEVLAYLRERELISSAYVETRAPVVLEDGRVVEAVAYVMDRAHEQYTGALPLERQAEVIASAVGGMGRNDAYLYATVSHLDEMGCGDPTLSALADLVRTRNGDGGARRPINSDGSAPNDDVNGPV
jgi:cation transport protein ChaC